MVVVRVDDILVSGRSDAEHVRNLDAVLKKLSEAGQGLRSRNVGLCSQVLIIWGV